MLHYATVADRMVSSQNGPHACQVLVVFTGPHKTS